MMGLYKRNQSDGFWCTTRKCGYLAAAAVLFALYSCKDSSTELSEQFVTLSGSLGRDEILLRARDGEFVGLSIEELVELCGKPEETDKYPQYEYKVVVGVCDSYVPAYQWLLAHLEEGRVVEVRIDCD